MSEMILSNEELDKKIALGNENKVTKQQIESRIKDISYTLFEGNNLTHCTLTLDNGFISTGESVCVDVENFKKDVGRTLSYNNAFAKLWVPFGFMLCEENFLKNSF